MMGKHPKESEVQSLIADADFEGNDSHRNFFVNTDSSSILI